MDERELQLLANVDGVRKEILESIPNEDQRKLVEAVMTSPQWNMAEIVQRNAELEKENRAAQHEVEEGRRARQEADKLRSRLASAEAALNAASKAAEKERFARLSAEDARDELLAAVHRASTEKSRLERLLERHGSGQ